MRRALTALLLVAVAAAGAGTAAVARKAPPRHHHAAKHKPARHKHHKKPAHKPAITTTPAVTTTPSTPTTPAPVTTTTPADTTPAPDTTPAAPVAPLSHALGVTASDAPGGGFVLSLSRTVLGSGAETVNFVNRSQDGHDLRIDDAGGIAQQTWDELASLATPVTESVTLAPGTYRVYCTLHLGMEKQLTVQAG